ncbi:ABC transporter permease [Pistricoccus aurantiacus]|uniref:ABC transporter permease n=1 Tax=Pistricoccus aurantiacus TaxID=1883414 RepID=A0A5B8SQR9_9GAMM|nr:ABC transporter permease [Pistricoccus aurantiacus]QEA37745.1 ABC transporter permease [Pistricoccus aurantiacus]
MSLIAFLGALELGLIFGFVALGVYLSFRVLEFPDLTVDGSFPLGAAVAAVWIVGGGNPWIGILFAMLAGSLAGIITAWMAVKLNILNLLASILTMIALYSVNLRIMGRPNIALLTEETVFTPLDTLPVSRYILYPLAILVGLALVTALLNRFLNSEVGLAMRATGENPRMASGNGINTDRMVLMGMALSNALVALGGALFAQSQGSADVTMGVGTIVVGLAAVIGGQSLLPGRSIFMATLACIFGSILYRIMVALALSADFIGLEAQDLNLVTALLVGFALVLPRFKRRRRA